MTTEHFDNYVNDNYDILRIEFTNYLVSECGYSLQSAQESDDWREERVRESYEFEHGKYNELISQIALTYTEAEKADVDVKVSVYGVEKESMKILAKKYEGDYVESKEMATSIIPFKFGKVLLFDKKA